MKRCQYIEGCAFFNERMADMPATAELMKKRYCLGDETSCARYMVLRKKGRDQVPAGLFPNQLGEAQRIMQD